MHKKIVLISMMTLFFSAGICEAQGNKPPVQKTGETQQPVQNQKEVKAIEPAQKLGEAQQDVYEPVVIYQGKWGSGDGEFMVSESSEFGVGPWILTTDTEGNIYVLDAWNARVLKFTSEGKYLGKIDLERQEGVKSMAELRESVYIGCEWDRLAIDKEGNMYIGGFQMPNWVVLVYDKNGKYVKDLREELGLKTVVLQGIDQFDNVYVSSDDKPFIEDKIKLDDGRIVITKYGYYKIANKAIEKIYEIPKLINEPKGIMKNDKYGEGYRRVFRTHVSDIGDMYGLYWDEKDQQGGVKILKWEKQK